MRDWLLKKFEDDEGNFDKDDLARFVKKFIPRKDDWTAIKNAIVIEGRTVKFLAKVAVNIDIKTGEVSFSLPDFGLGFKETIIESDVWDSCKEDLVKGRDIWGMVELGYRSPDDFDFSFEYERKTSKAKNSKDGKIKLISFKNFCPYEIDLDDYKEARKTNWPLCFYQWISSLEIHIRRFWLDTGHYPFRLHDVSFRLSVQPRSLINKITGGLFGVKTRVSIAKTMKNRAK